MITLESIPTSQLVTKPKKKRVLIQWYALHLVQAFNEFLWGEKWEILYLLLHHNQSFIKHEWNEYL